MGVMSVRLYWFWQPSELQPSARSPEELQMESITIYFDAWESLDIDLGVMTIPQEVLRKSVRTRCRLWVSALCNKIIPKSQRRSGLPRLS